MSIVTYIFTPAITVFLFFFMLSILFSYPILIKMLFYLNGFSCFATGIMLYFLIHIFWGNSKIISQIYIISHELSHALAGIISGNRIKKIKIFKDRGYVSFSRNPDKFTTIFPYLFPFYNILTATISLFVYLFWNLFNYKIFLIIEGFCLSFHIINTFSIILTPQSDFKKLGGRFKSFFMIIFVNSIIVYIITIAFFPNKKMVLTLIDNIFYNYILIVKSFLKLISYILNVTINYVYKIF